MDRAMMEMLSGHPSLALSMCDGEGHISFATPALERMLGGFRADTVCEYAALLEWFDVAGHRLSADDLPLARAVRGDTVVDSVLYLQRSDGHTIYLRCNAAPLRDHDGCIRGGIVLIQDITVEWIVVSRQDELRDRLVTTVNHELRTPLTKLLGHSELLAEAAEQGDLPAALKRSTAAITRASHELADMAARLSHLADLDATSRALPGSGDVSAVLRTAVEALQRAARVRHVEIEMTGPVALDATIDASLLARAARELVTNAINHAPSGSTVFITLSDLDDHLEIAVADQGPGVAASERRRVVQPFERGDTAQGLSSTTGLGLAVVSTVAAAHHGTLVLEDNEPQGLIARVRILRHLG